MSALRHLTKLLCLLIILLNTACLVTVFVKDADSASPPESTSESTGSTGEPPTGSQTEPDLATTTDSETDSTAEMANASTGEAEGPYCGDGVIQGDEECDKEKSPEDGQEAKEDLGGKTCQILIGMSGVLHCTDQCTFDVSLCYGYCGNGILEPGEQCDVCSPEEACVDCRLTTPSTCGNQLLEPGETCDDGNIASGDGCNHLCLKETCGDHMVQADLGEQCDDGNQVNGDGCQADCTLTSETPCPEK